MKIKIKLLFFSFLSTIAWGQMAMGSWRTHFSYNEVSKVEQTNKKTYALSDGALFSVDKVDNLLETYSKINGLNDFSITLMAYNPQTKLLLLAYSNGNIDLLSDDGDSYNIPDIKNKIISVAKTPNDIFFKDEFGYISSAIGIVVVNMNKKEVVDTYIIGENNTSVNVKSTVIFKDSIYAITTKGIYSASAGNKFLVDYNNWEFRNNNDWKFNTEQPDNDKQPDNEKLVVFNNQLFLLKNSGKVYSSVDAQTWNLFDESASYKNIRVSDNNLILSSSTNIVRYNSYMVPEHLSAIEILYTLYSANMVSEQLSEIEILDALYNQSSQTYSVASNTNGLIMIKKGSMIQQFKPQGPATNKILGLAFQDSRLFAITGAPWDVTTPDNQAVTGALMIFEAEKWKNFIKKDLVSSGKDFIGLTSIAVDPKDSKHYFVSSWRDGMYEFRNDAFYNRYSEINSAIERSDGGTIDDYNNTDGVCFDKNGHLWFNNMLTGASIKVFLNGDVTSPVKLIYRGTSVNGSDMMNRATFDNIIVAKKNNYKWFNFLRKEAHGGIFVINDNNDPSDKSNHQYIYYNSIQDQDGETISLAPTYCFAEDTDGNIWAGTSMGPVIFKNVANVFNSNYTVTRPKIPRNDGTDYADYLLNGVNVKSIAVDGGNRKWIGTFGAGVYLVSPDGLKTVHHFTAENSPLLSNDIMAIKVNDNTGEVFFATSMGLISYQSDATIPNPQEAVFSSIIVFPNPVRENFQGVITIKGLKENTTVKITDAAGSIVYQTSSNGGMATWNGICKNGKKASSGVYFVMVSSTDSSDNTQTGIGKFLIVK